MVAHDLLKLLGGTALGTAVAGGLFNTAVVGYTISIWGWGGLASLFFGLIFLVRHLQHMAAVETSLNKLIEIAKRNADDDATEAINNALGQ